MTKSLPISQPTPYLPISQSTLHFQIMASSFLPMVAGSPTKNEWQLAATTKSLLPLPPSFPTPLTTKKLLDEEMRIHPSRNADTADMDDEGGDTALLAAKGRVVTQVAKKNLIQIAVPIFIELKRLLESKNSPITGCLMECLRVLLKDYKNEFDEILVADKQLQKELIYDMQKYDAAKAKSTVAKAVANEQRAEGFRSPLNPSASRIYAKVSEKLGTGAKIASAVADAAARATARSVLKEVSRNIASPPLHTMSVPRLKTATGIGQASRRNRPSEVLESLRRRQSFEFDDEN